MTEIAADAVVVGAGTAGVGAALQLARRGYSVVLLEQRVAGTGGARWCNGVVPWQFDRAGIDQPVFPEARSAGGTGLMVGPDGSTFRVDDSPVVETDMRLLNERLLAAALEAGVQLLDRVDDVRAELRDGRLHTVRLTAAEPGGTPTPARITASLFVDATGRAAVLRRQVPDLDRWCPTVRPVDLCSAAQFTHRITDPRGARAFLESHGIAPGDTVTWVGFAGGFSALVIQVSEDCSEVGILTGTLGTDAWGSGRSILELAVAQHGWIGGAIFGGAGLIPLRRPYARLTAPGLALVGDSGCQVFPAHGSGIGVGLVAGRILAESVEHASDPGAAEALWAYQASFMHELGGTLAAYDAVRRLSTAIGSAGVAELFRSGLVDAQSTLDGLAQRWAVPDPAAVAAQAGRLVRRPALAARVTPWLARAAAAPRCYAAYPNEFDPPALRRWSGMVDATLGRSGA